MKWEENFAAVKLAFWPKNFSTVKNFQKLLLLPPIFWMKLQTQTMQISEMLIFLASFSDCGRQQWKRFSAES